MKGKLQYEDIEGKEFEALWGSASPVLSELFYSGVLGVTTGACCCPTRPSCRDGRMDGVKVER